jgi:hypothetical protein
MFSCRGKVLGPQLPSLLDHVKVSSAAYVTFGGHYYSDRLRRAAA